MTRPDDVPPHAEAFSAMDFVVTRRTPSKFLAGVEQIATFSVCPRCRHERPQPNFGRKINCAQCGLSMYETISYLFAWPEEAPAPQPRERADV